MLSRVIRATVAEYYRDRVVPRRGPLRIRYLRRRYEVMRQRRHPNAYEYANFQMALLLCRGANDLY